MAGGIGQFLSLLFLSSLVDYFIGSKIYHSKNNKIKNIFMDKFNFQS